MWEVNEEDGVRYVVLINGWKLECIKDGELYNGLGDVGGFGLGEEIWNFDCVEERFI